jgi:hypothetical protein
MSETQPSAGRPEPGQPETDWPEAELTVERDRITTGVEFDLLGVVGLILQPEPDQSRHDPGVHSRRTTWEVLVSGVNRSLRQSGRDELDPETAVSTVFRAAQNLQGLGLIVYASGSYGLPPLRFHRPDGVAGDPAAGETVIVRGRVRVHSEAVQRVVDRSTGRAT